MDRSGEEELLRRVRQERAERPEADRRSARREVTTVADGRRSDSAAAACPLPYNGLHSSMDAFIRAVTSMSRATGLIGALLIGAAVLVICDMVIERYVFNLTTIWQIDVVTYSVVAATFIGSPYVLM